MKTFFCKLLGVGFGLVFILHAGATTYYVNVSNAVPTSPYTNWNMAATNIQDAVDISADGDLILVTNGIYQTGGRIVYGALTNEVVINKAVAVQSVNGPAVTMIRGGGIAYSDSAVRCVYLTNGAALAGFTIMNGSTRSVSWGTVTPENCGGGVWCESTGTVISNCVLAGNIALMAGGAVYGGTLINCTMSNNTCAMGGGAAFSTLTNCLLTGNVGGGAYQSRLDACTIQQNSTPSGGGGVKQCTLDHCAVLNNYAGYGGGSSGSVLSNCTVTGNTALAYGGGALAGTLVNCTVTGNTVNRTNACGGYVDGGGASGATLINCVVSGNQVKNSLMGNSATYGGGVSGGVATNCLLIGNSCWDGGGGAYNATLNNCTVVGNSDKPYFGGAVYNCTVNNSIVYFNTFNNYYGSSLNYCCANPLPGGAGNTAADPQFANRGGGDYHLQANSPCVNSGINSCVANPSDLDGNPRIVGGTVDMGAYEYQVPLYFLRSPTNQILLAGTDFVLSATALGDQPGYQWWFNGAPLADGGRISGATSNSLTISLSQTNDTGSYWVTASNSSGVVTSGVAIVMVLQQPVVITGQPTNRMVLTSSNTAFAVTAFGIVPPNYLWYSNGVALANGGRISGATSPTLTISGVQTNDSGASYQVLVTNSYGAVTSQVATLTVLAPAQITSQPVSQAVLLGSNATISIAASGSSLDYQWFFNGITLTDGGHISGSTTPALSISNVQSGDAGGYVVVVSNIMSSATSVAASLTPLATLAPSVRYVALTCTNPSSPYLDWSTAATNIQDAVDAAVAGDTVLVTNGIYNAGGRVVFGKETNRVVLAKAITLFSVNGSQATTIVGGHQMRGVYVGSNAFVGGFTITNGYADVSAQGSDPVREQSGGGVWCEALNATVSNCVLTSNNANGYGGGAFSGTLVACVVRNNNANLGGGGTCSNVLVNCVLTGNSAVRSGGGGAQNCTLNNCTIVANTATGKQASGAYNSVLNNCIVYYNTPIQDTYGCALNYCCTPVGSGVGVNTNAPLFIDQAAGDFHLQSNSPCINSGHNDYLGGTSDFDGNPRIAGGTVDMGAYEYQTPGSVISYAWLQQYGLPTDGSVDYLDLDGTGMNNWQKWIAGLNPTNPASVLVILPPMATTNPAGLTVTWQSVNTRTYFLQRGTNLAAQPVFSVLHSNIVGQAGTTSCTDTTATNDGRYFYRVGVRR
jgi:hypothetical protein